MFHSLRCDCRAQLELSLDLIAAEGRGLLIYEHQEGRGIGLANKLRAYQLQDAGADTVEANLRLGFKADHRDYELPADILHHFGVPPPAALEQPRQDRGARSRRHSVAERVPCEVAPGASSAYLRTKKEKLGHLLDL